MDLTESTDHFSDEGLMALHQMYAKARRIKPAFVYKIKEATHYNSLLLRVPVTHNWEIEKVLIDNNIKID